MLTLQVAEVKFANKLADRFAEDKQERSWPEKVSDFTDCFSWVSITLKFFKTYFFLRLSISVTFYFPMIQRDYFCFAIYQPLQYIHWRVRKLNRDA